MNAGGDNKDENESATKLARTFHAFEPLPVRVVEINPIAIASLKMYGLNHLPFQSGFTKYRDRLRIAAENFVKLRSQPRSVRKLTVIPLPCKADF